MGAFCSCFSAHHEDDAEVTPSSLTHSSTTTNRQHHANTRVLRFFHRCSLAICPVRLWILEEEVATVQQPEAAGDCSSTPTAHHSIQSTAQATLDSPDSSSEEECPTCLEGYTVENPKMTTKCSHHFHLPCILEWQQRSAECPKCRKVLIVI